MIIGTTGTQLFNLDLDSVCDIVARALSPYTPHRDIVVSGLCIGMDEVVVTVADKLGFSIYGICPYNRSKVSARAMSVVSLKGRCEFMPPGTTYMDRNDRIIRPIDIPPIDVLLAFPKAAQEEVRSGTWATVRRAWRAIGRDNVFIHPVGGN